MKKVSIFIVTYAKDYPYLVFCLRSIEKFATGFHEVCILVPNEHLEELKKMVSELPGTSGIPFRCVGGEEWAEKGFVWHMAQICRADEWCPDADYICHFDPDCVFTAPVTPETFFNLGKPIIQYEPFESINKRHGGVGIWKTVTEKCVPFEVSLETMRQHGLTFRRDIYPEARHLVSSKTGESFDDYLKSCTNSYPQSFCEFVTLGNVAWNSFPNDYYWSNRCLQENRDKGLFPIFQSWSHNSPETATDLWHEGVNQKIVPLEIYKKLGLA